MPAIFLWLDKFRRLTIYFSVAALLLSHSFTRGLIIHGLFFGYETAMFASIILALIWLASYTRTTFQAEAVSSTLWQPDASARQFTARKQLPPFIEESSIATYSLPLRAKGRDVVDTTDRRFKLSSINWYGASDEIYIPGGLEARHRSDIAKTIKSLGFNSVRLPYSDQMVIENPHILPHVLLANPDLVGKRALDIYKACAEALTDAGIAVIPNNHITSAIWCCGADPCDAGWANDHLGPICPIKQSEEDWIQHWETIMGLFIGNPLVIGADLRNEVRGLWGTLSWDRWATAAEKAGNRLLKMNPEWLIIVGGTESNNDLSGVRTRPVVLDLPDRVVYEAHVYGWSGWGDQAGRYSQRSYASFMQSCRKNWAYLLEDEIAPVWVGEFGAPRSPSAGDAHYWHNLMRYLKDLDADFGYWALNPRKPNGHRIEGYSILRDDWITPIYDYRMRDMTELMAGKKESSGRDNQEDALGSEL